MSGVDIFLSYARQDRATARMFAECLTDEGFKVWWDASLHSGETFDEVIERNLREAGAVVVLWSPRSTASRWVRAEATLADRRNKLAPVIIEPCDRPIIFELTHTADLSSWTGDMTDTHWRTFVSDLHRLIAATRDQAHGTSHPATAQKADETLGRSQPANRQPLRPGSADVIFADRRLREPHVAASHVRGAAAESVPNQSEAHCLEIEEGDVAEHLVVVHSSGMKIGRAAPADIVISHKSISREHCIIGIANDDLLVTDLNSTNGTYIDGARISRATILPVGSILKLGEVSLRHAVQAGEEADRLGGLNRSGGKGGMQAGRFAAAS